MIANVARSVDILDILVLGIGNTLLSDEGVGVHAVEALRRRRADLPGVEFIDGGTMSFLLAAAIEDCDGLIVVDAGELKAEPGCVSVFEQSAMADFLGSNTKRSVHEVGLIDLMAVAALAGRLPEHRALVCIQPQFVDWGELPSEPVARAVPLACEQVLALIERWRA